MVTETLKPLRDADLGIEPTAAHRWMMIARGSVPAAVASNRFAPLYA
jgi:hypothetical protein